MGDFCKIFEDEEKGQIVAMPAESDEGFPEVRFFCRPKGMGVCSVKATAGDSEDETFNKMRAAFDRTVTQHAVAYVQHFFDLAALSAYLDALGDAVGDGWCFDMSKAPSFIAGEGMVQEIFVGAYVNDFGANMVTEVCQCLGGHFLMDVRMDRIRSTFYAWKPTPPLPSPPQGEKG